MINHDSNYTIDVYMILSYISNSIIWREPNGNENKNDYNLGFKLGLGPIIHLFWGF